MADEIIATGGTAGDAPGVAETATIAAEAATSPAATSAIEAAPETAVEAVVAEAETPPAAADAAPAEPAKEADKPAEAKADEVKPDETETKAEAEAPEAVTFESFKLPEGITVAPEQAEAFMGVFNEAGLTPETGQKFIDLHADVVKKAAEAMDQRQRDVFAETQAQWVKDFDKSAGNKRDTILNGAKAAIVSLIPDAKSRKEVWDVLAYTGAGNNKAIINLLAAANRRMTERSAPPPAVPSTQAQKMSPAERRYSRAARP